VQVTVPSYAKLNLDLRVLYKRPDNYHEIRSIFQTISLKDTLQIDFEFAKRTSIYIDSSVEIADNLVVRAAEPLLKALKVRAAINFKLIKKIPMGAGLGGGSSNAAAVLLALPSLAGKPASSDTLLRIAETLGSDIPFFLLGGTALALGRGTELYPLPDLPPHHAVVVHSGVHVSTPHAYRNLNRSLLPDVTNALEEQNLKDLPLTNDFEDAVFKMHPELAATARRLRKLGAKPALMTGSGSALFGLFPSSAVARAAAAAFPSAQATAVRFVNRTQYRRRWLAALAAKI
jgi:4-diphosphocytidyl-2-C-methyl-D-erythritol kinase